MVGATLPSVQEPAFSKNGLNLLRLMLALLVIQSHSWYLLRHPPEEEPLARLTHLQMNGGALAVNLFFALSGYLVSASWARNPSFAAFLCRRALRIYPGFIVVCLWQAAFVIPLTLGAWSAFPPITDWGQLLMAIVTMGGVGYLANPRLELFPTSISRDINGSLWTIRYEVLCYLLLGLLGLFGALRYRWLRWFLFGGLLAFFVIWPDADMHWVLTSAFGPWELWARLPVYFLGGMFVYWETGRIPRNAWTLTFAILALVVAVAGSAPWLRAIGPLVLPWLMLHAGHCVWPTRIARWLPGDFSYGIYLYGFPVQQLLLQFTSDVKWTVWGFTIAAALLTLPLAVASWYFVEAPALRRSPESLGRTPRKRPPRPGT